MVGRILTLRRRRTDISANGRVEQTTQPVEKLVAELKRDQMGMTAQPFSERGKNEQKISLNS
jgi:hypothetical protein